MPLREIFEKIATKEDGKQTISHKVAKLELEEFFFGILPDYDEDRVYPSDIKKVVQWYNLLVKNGFTDFSEPAQEGEDKPAKDATPEDKAPKATSKKKAASKQVNKAPVKATKKAVTQNKKVTTAKKK